MILEKKKNPLVFNGKILLRISIFEENILKMFITDTLAKTSQNILAYSFVSEHSKHFSSFWEENKLQILAVYSVYPPNPPLKWTLFYVLPQREVRKLEYVKKQINGHRQKIDGQSHL